MNDTMESNNDFEAYGTYKDVSGWFAAGSRRPPSPIGRHTYDIIDPVCQLALANPYTGAFTDFFGLPSNPLCIFKTGKPWRVRTGQAWRISREARPVCVHPIQPRWLEIGQLICEHLDSRDVEWTSVDPVCFAEAEKEETTGLHLWIGVVPGTLAFEAAKEAAEGCKNILAREGFLDIEVAFRQSVVTESVGPKLLSLKDYIGPIHELRSPFTPTLGLQIAPLEAPHFEGTGAVYLREGGPSDRVFLLTANHVARPPAVHDNQPLLHPYNSQPREEIVVLGTKAYSDAINRMTSTIKSKHLSIEMYSEWIENLGPFVEDEEPNKTCTRKRYQHSVEKAKRKIEYTNQIHDEVSKQWTTPNQRAIGYVVHAPTIAIDDGPEPFARDWALIELYRDKFDWDTFQGNKVYVGDVMSSYGFIVKMHPHSEGRSNLKYPLDGLLQVTGVLKEDEIHNPQQLDFYGEKCLIVFKNGKTTGPTFGRATSMESFVRTYPAYGIKKTSIHIAVYPYGKKDGAFSAPGDSGSIAVDWKGRIVGMLVAGAGTTEATDVTYLTPYWWIEEQMKKVYPDISLYEPVDSDD
ncbi:hypothetical protein H0H81_008369 [Sphagnurus paluster]|uniref:Uncharacterized protein n=1 Tax=Sphagnurus paluster TaxID=117069 RepID=A0A9P7K610_9AGAR|nr:hypothetical protein H0H81_008369 [Sphagnurus paluster]